MPTDVKVPSLGESITEAEVLEWLVAEGDAVEVDQDLVVLETDKITVNVPAPAAGTLVEQVVAVGDTVEVGAVLARLEEGAGEKAKAGASKATGEKAEAPAKSSGEKAEAPAKASGEKAEAPAKSSGEKGEAPAKAPGDKAEAGDEPLMLPAARRLVEQHGLDPRRIEGSGRGGRLLKEDVQRYLDEHKAARDAAPAPRPAEQAPAPAASAAPSPAAERVVPMSRLRRKVAENLLHAQQTAAMLTTFNEIDMTEVMALRRQHQDAFQKRYGIKVGFMSFFVKAAIEALKAYPSVNAEIRDDAIVYKDYYHVGIAVGGGRGLVVPVVRDADQLGFAEIEQRIATLAEKARESTLSLEDLQGGTFTISNGGVYGSLLSTPILNPPQVGILGLHKIEDRPVARDGQVVVRPMMYVALTYDHRLIDGREAVGFLVRIKEVVEEPTRLMLEV